MRKQEIKTSLSIPVRPPKREMKTTYTTNNFVREILVALKKVPPDYARVPGGECKEEGRREGKCQRGCQGGRECQNIKRHKTENTQAMPSKM